MLTHRRGILRDRRGISGTAVGALLAIVVLLFYLQFISTLHGAEVAFWAIFGFLKWLASLLGYPHLFDEFEKLIKELQGTPFWPMLVYMLSLAFMSSSLYGTLYGTKGIVDITTRILAWRRARREEKRKIREKNERKYRLWKQKLEWEDEGPSALQSKLNKIMIDKEPSVHKRLKTKASIKVEKTSSIFKVSEGWEKLLFTEWWEIRLTEVITLVKGKFREIILEAKKLFPTNQSPEGSYIELAKAIGMDVHGLRRAVREGSDSMTVESLLKLLDVMKAPYDALTPYVKSIGSSGYNKAIVNPKFPINMNNPDGGIILAAALKDGCINSADHRFEYTNYDPENRKIVIGAVQRVFGDIEPGVRYNQEGKQKGIYFNSAIIGDALLRAGAVEGRKTEQDFGLPNMIKYGNLAIRKAYFEQAIRDEGSIDYHNYKVSISNAQEIESKAELEHLRMIEYFAWELKILPSGAIELFVNISDKLRDEIPDTLKPVYDSLLSKMKVDWVPTILKEEAQILEKTYGVVAKVVPKDIYKGKSGLRGSWMIVVKGKNDFSKMVSQLTNVKKGGEGKE